MAHPTDSSTEGRRERFLAAFFQAGNNSFRDARNRCSHAVRHFSDIPIDAPAAVRVAAWKRITEPDFTRITESEIICEDDGEDHMFTAEIAFQDPSAVPSAPLIKTPVYLDYGLRVHVAPTAFINRNCIILDTPVADVRIGEHVNIGPNVTILSVGHIPSVDQHGKRLSNGSDVSIGDFAWIEAGPTILPGVEIGSHSIIGAGSVATRDVPAYHAVYGNPARVARRIRNEVEEEPGDIITSLRDALEYQGRADGTFHG